MLAELRIENLLLISRAHIEFVGGFNAFTGETGAGKSLLLDAIEFLLGGRGDTAMVRPGAAQAEVSARFILQDRELIDALSNELGIIFDTVGDGPAELVLSRIQPRTGRGRAHANGRPVAIPALKELSERLLDIHGQDQNQSLLRPSTRLEILDRFAEAAAERAAVRKAWQDTHDAARALAELRRAVRNRQGREDLLRFQLKELEDADLDDLDPDALENELRLLRGAEKIRSAVEGVASVLDGDDAGATVRLARALKTLHALGDAGAEVKSLTDRLDGLLNELHDVARDAEDLAERARSNPARLAELEDARDQLRALQRKHGRDVPALRALRDRLRADLEDFDSIDEKTEEREAALARAITALGAACEKLTRRRKTAARDLEKRIARELADLGFKDARLNIALVPHAAEGSVVTTPDVDGTESLEQETARLLPATLRPTGAESADLLFSANPELPQRPLKECASGGELARVMLAIKGVLARVAGADRLPVVVFDEVDAGVGGRLGAILGRKLADLAGVRQVLCVTHQPQLAAYADRQLKVDKSRDGQSTTVRIECLEGQRRVDEIALMLRGSEASDHTREEAAAMLREARVR